MYVYTCNPSQQHHRRQIFVDRNELHFDTDEHSVLDEEPLNIVPNMLVGADPSQLTRVWAEEEIRFFFNLLSSFVSLLVLCLVVVKAFDNFNESEECTLYIVRVSLLHVCHVCMCTCNVYKCMYVYMHTYSCTVHVQ